MRPKCYIGIVLFGHAGDAVASLRDRISDAFGAPRSNSPPHLTLFYPFEAEDLPRLRSRMTALAVGRMSFSVPFEGYGAFDGSVWYLSPKPDSALAALRQDVRAAVRDAAGLEERTSRIDSPFHATLAKKYAPDAHPRIEAFLRKEPFPETLTVDHLALFHRPSGEGRWHPIEILFFGR